MQLVTANTQVVIVHKYTVWDEKTGGVYCVVTDTDYDELKRITKDIIPLSRESSNLFRGEFSVEKFTPCDQCTRKKFCGDKLRCDNLYETVGLLRRKITY